MKEIRTTVGMNAEKNKTSEPSETGLELSTLVPCHKAKQNDKGEKKPNPFGFTCMRACICACIEFRFLFFSLTCK